MHKISIEADAAYREEPSTDGYREICPACGADRIGHNVHCTCGRPFSKKERGFFKAGFEPPRLSIVFPRKCPKTLGPIAKTLTFATRRVTGAWGGGAKVTHLMFDVPVGKTMRSPLLWYFSGIVLAFFAVVFGLAALFSVLDNARQAATTGLIALVCLTGLVWAWREYTWFRVAYYDHRSVVFKARQKEYARELARANRGRIR